ncbi:ATP-dependent zinc metalloprotease FtsH [Colletotrichum siamense]|nr:ATP-dependent zinc metalloprotease FtsH [Colletotrichum siamense]
MSDVAADDKNDGSNPAPRLKTRILRYDEVFDVRAGQIRLIKSEKSNIGKQNRKKAVLMVRRLINDKGIHTETKIDIKSKRVAQVMQEINADVEEVSLKTNPPVVTPETIFHSQQGLQESMDKARQALPPDEELVADLMETVKFAEEEHATTRGNLLKLLESGEITWELIWAIFPPNILVYRYHRLIEQNQLLQLRSIQKVVTFNRPPYWQLNCRIIVDDGVKFGLAYEPFLMAIEEFSGTRKIVDLRIFPLKYHADPEAVRAEALRYGRRFVALNEPRVMETSGPAMFEKRDSRREAYAFKFASQGRTMIDPAGFRSFNPNLEFMPEVHRGLSREELTDEQLMTCSPVAFGFCFGNKKWGGFATSRLSGINWDDQAFKDLVLDTPTKTLVRSMVKQHSSQDDGFDDIISGKGKGIVCLFSGPPGSGKTLTAEAVAEITKRPLYSVSAGDLGIDPITVDKRLSEILEQSHKWNAVLLIDEADVFLQQREAYDIQRNALVSIFLRQLEYYQGILILTTNRITDFDTAFESRVHISHEYPELDEAARKQIWSMFLRRLKDMYKGATVGVTEEDISWLSKLEIKNILNSARIVAKDKGEVFSISHIKLVLNATNSDVHVKQAGLNGA